MPFFLKFESYGENGVLISWPDVIDQTTSHDVFNLNLQIHKHLSRLILETVPAYCSLMVFTKNQIDHKEFINNVKNIYQSIEQCLPLNPSIWQIPVCYDLSFGLDLKTIAELKGISTEEIIKIHSQRLYTIDFFGFLPGFPYLSGLDKTLHTPRFSKPRALVAKGSVAIGAGQTGIYPSASPGGWHIVGRTPVSLFNPQNILPCEMKPLDKIIFKPISLNEFKNIHFKLVKISLEDSLK